MAQTGYTPILIYASGTTTNVPLAANLTSSSAGAELALNYADGKLFYKDSGGVVQVLATKGAGTIGGSNTQVQYNSSGALAGSANFTFNGTNLTLGTAGVGSLFQGDFSNATLLNRTSFQTGTANSTTGIYALPNGTSTAASWQATNASDPTNASKILIATNGSTDVQLVSGRNGTGTYLPLSFYTSNTNQMQLDITGGLTMNGTTFLQLVKGTTAQRPGSPITGMIRYNTDTAQFEGYSGSSPSWLPVGGSVISNDTSTSSNVYPTFVSATTGTATTLYTGNAKLLYKPSTGEFQASEFVALNGLFVNATTIATSYTVPSGYNAQSVGPITINSGVSITVSSGQRWVVI
jgi:hypothetical protein